MNDLEHRALPTVTAFLRWIFATYSPVLCGNQKCFAFLFVTTITIYYVAATPSSSGDSNHFTACWHCPQSLPPLSYLCATYIPVVYVSSVACRCCVLSQLHCMPSQHLLPEPDLCKADPVPSPLRPSLSLSEKHQL